MQESNPILGEQFKELIWNQIKNNDPPITKETYHRLVSEGFDENETIRLMACVVSTETYYVLKYKRPFDEKRYEKMMRKLPKMPWD